MTDFMMEKTSSIAIFRVAQTALPDFILSLCFMVSTALASPGKEDGSWNRSMSGRMVAFAINSYARGDLVLFAEHYVTFTEIAVIRNDISNSSESFW
ncbi:MAG: hypothetical protein ACLQT6_19225 [Desulfomonilaceae bacterium]